MKLIDIQDIDNYQDINNLLNLGAQFIFSLPMFQLLPISYMKCIYLKASLPATLLCFLIAL